VAVACVIVTVSVVNTEPTLEAGGVLASSSVMWSVSGH